MTCSIRKAVQGDSFYLDVLREAYIYNGQSERGKQKAPAAKFIFLGCENNFSL